MGEVHGEENIKLYEQAKIISSLVGKDYVNEVPVDDGKMSVGAFSSKVYGDIIAALKKSDHKVVIIIDDINTLATGSVRVQEHGVRLTEEEIQRRQTMGTDIFTSWCTISTSDHHLVSNTNDDNIILFVAASQHYNFLSKLEGKATADHVKPTTTLWDIVGYSHLYNKTLIVDSKTSYLPKVRRGMVKVLLQESGVIPRTVQWALKQSEDKVVRYCTRNDLEIRYAVQAYLSTLITKVREGIRKRYDEVFINFYSHVSVFSDFSRRNDIPEEIKKENHRSFVESSINCLEQHSFELTEKLDAYFDTGLIIEHDLLPGIYGFMSNTFKMAFGEIMGNNEAAYQRTTYFPIHRGDGQGFQRYVERGLLLRGLYTNQLVSYQYGRPKTGSPLYKAPPAYRRVSVNFTEGELNGKPLWQVGFEGGESVRDEFVRWATTPQTTSQTFMLTTGVSAPDMKGFDEVLVSNELQQTGDIMHFFAVQVSTEGPELSSIPNKRFEKFESYGVHVLDSIVRLVWPERRVKINHTLPKTMNVYTKGQKVKNVAIHLVYISLKERCIHTDSQRIWYDTWVMLRKGCQENFMVTFDPTVSVFAGQGGD